MEAGAVYEPPDATHWDPWRIILKPEIQMQISVVDNLVTNFRGKNK